MLRIPTKSAVFMLLLAASIALTAGVNAASPPPAVDAQIKCDCIPCGCVHSPPPPSPPPPPPMPYCPPPPTPFFFLEGTPANNLYPYDPAFYPSSARRSCAGLVNAALVLSGLIIAHIAIQLGVPL